MYATVRTYTDAPGLTDALLQHQDEIRGLLTGIDGFRAYYLIRTGEGATTISVYDDEAGAAESTRVAASWVAANLGDLGVAPPQVTAGEVPFNI